MQKIACEINKQELKIMENVKQMRYSGSKTVKYDKCLKTFKSCDYSKLERV